MEFISKQYEEMKNKFSKMETERREHLAYIQMLEGKIENLEKCQKQTCIEIRNVPVPKSESKEDLICIVQKVCNTTNTHIEEHHIKDIFRLNADKGGMKSIIIDFYSVIMKERLLSSIKSFNRINNQNKLNTTHLEMAGQPKPIFVSECLTQKTKRTFYLAREYCKKNGYEFCWTAHGRVYLRKGTGARAHRIESASDLDRLDTHQDS
ncbi:unnamed protein product [Arctia plantaginis]|uniref:FP protein C-terminal domain-containing protein n=1 Tax=Arctia plantaginis TaxID=874455 RepID=A0A8S1BUC4_ARCPL|nr:unnamed protein product [Arctia plantaginis]